MVYWRPQDFLCDIEKEVWIRKKADTWCHLHFGIFNLVSFCHRAILL